MARRATIPMTPLDPTKTRKATNRRTGRAETIEAVSADGHWGYAREDDRGTRWYIRDLWAGEHVNHSFGNLTRARRWTHHEDATAVEPLAS